MEGKNSGLINRDHKWQMQKGFTVSLIKRGVSGVGVGLPWSQEKGNHKKLRKVEGSQ